MLTIREKTDNSISTFCLIAVAVFACMFLPESIDQFKNIFLSSILLVYFITQLVFRQKTYLITSIDFWWLILFLYSAFSTLWSNSESYQLGFAFHQLQLYLVFKIFENLSWEEESTRKIVTTFSGIAIGLLLLFQVIYIIQNGLLGNFGTFEESIIHIVPCLLSILVLPYLIFTKENLPNYVAGILITINLITAYILNLPQAMIVIAILAIAYTLFKIEYIRRIKYQVMLGFLIILGATLFYTVNYKDVGNESYAANPSYVKAVSYLDGINYTLNKIGDAPIIGHGTQSIAEIAQINEGTKRSAYFPNNMVIAVLYEHGIIGIIILCYIGLFPILRIFNERNILSSIELAAVVSISLFFFLSLFYGEVYSQGDYMASATILATIGMAFISRTANKNTLITETKSKHPNLIYIGITIVSLIYWIL